MFRVGQGPLKIINQGSINLFFIKNDVRQGHGRPINVLVKVHEP